MRLGVGRETVKGGLYSTIPFLLLRVGECTFWPGKGERRVRYNVLDAFFYSFLVSSFLVIVYKITVEGKECGL